MAGTRRTRRNPSGALPDPSDEIVARVMAETAPRAPPTAVPSKRSSSGRARKVAYKESDSSDMSELTDIEMEDGAEQSAATAKNGRAGHPAPPAETAETPPKGGSNFEVVIGSSQGEGKTGAQNGAGKPEGEDAPDAPAQNGVEEMKTEADAPKLEETKASPFEEKTTEEDADVDAEAKHEAEPVTKKRKTSAPTPQKPAKAPRGKRRNEAEILAATTSDSPRRSTRSRAAPTDRYAETLQKEADKPKPRRSGGGGGGGRRKKKLTIDEMFLPENIASKNSPWIDKIDVSAVFNKEFMENVLTSEQKAKLMSWLPECDKVYENEPADGSNPDSNPRINHALWTNSIFKDALANWRQDLADGKYEASYIAKGQEAHRKRMAGTFDAWKDGQFESFWGQKQRVSYDAIAGEASKIKLETLISHGAFKLGDIFSMRRGFAGGLMIRKEAKLVAIDTKKGLLSFEYPPGENEWEKQGVENKRVDNVDSMTNLENTLIKENGGFVGKIPNGNAFKTVRVVRKGEDIGSLFEVRAKFYQQYLKK